MSETQRMVHCQKLGIEALGLSQPPYPGELGQRIFANISQSAWQSWIKHQTMLINEYRLNLAEVEARKFLALEMEKFLFGTGSEAPPDYKPENSNT
jgi:Fe-S cluster biosynthesis and repair protein YggX